MGRALHGCICCSACSIAEFPANTCAGAGRRPWKAVVANQATITGGGRDVSGEGRISSEAVAVEPVVMDPVSVCYDADGRLYVVEMRGYPYPEKTASGKVSRLGDRDGDGRFETRTTLSTGSRGQPESFLTMTACSSRSRRTSSTRRTPMGTVWPTQSRWYSRGSGSKTSRDCSTGCSGDQTAGSMA